MKSHFHSQRHRLDDSLFGCLENDGDYSEHYLIKFINCLRRYQQLGFNLQMEALEDSGGTISNVTLLLSISSMGLLCQILVGYSCVSRSQLKIL